MRTRHIAPTALFTAIAALSLIGCGSSRNDTPDSGTPDAGSCFPFCGNNNHTDAGTDGGNNNNETDGGMPGTDGGCTSDYDGGVLTVTLRDIRNSTACTLPFGAHVEVPNVVVHTISYAKTGNQGDVSADFWVSDPNDPPYGMWVSKFYKDTPTDYMPAVGDVLTINGYYGTVRNYSNPTGYRQEIAEKYLGGGQYANMDLQKTGTAAVPDAVVVSPGEFGNADGGTVRPNADHAGSRVYIQGPIEITNPTPTAFQRVSANPDDSTYYGFEVTGGILINNSKTYKSDGGCPWQETAINAAANGQKVVFTQGIYGTWDTYTFAPCADGGTDVFGCTNNPGKVPGTNNNYTYVLYPQSCDDFAGGEVQAQ